MLDFAQEKIPHGTSFLHPDTGLPRVTHHAVERANERSNRGFADQWHLWKLLSDRARMGVIWNASSVAIPEWGIRLCVTDGVIRTVIPYESHASAYYTVGHRRQGRRSLVAR